MMKSSTRKHASRGYTLIEVLIGILIFAVGMMALAQLQGNLAQNSGDSNARTVGANIAEEVIETARSFSQIDSDGTNAAYNDIVGGTRTITRGGNTYTIVSDVTDYYYLDDGVTVTDTAPAERGRSDFKVLELTVSWDQKDAFRIDANTTTDALNTGSITLTEVISSITSPSGGKVVLGTGGDLMFAPPVDYSPGQNPDIVSINLGQNKFKESTTPLPDVIRADEIVETRFDVVTYSNPINSSATFLRREEFRAVSCECTLRVPTDGEGGLRPTIWDGNEYVEGEFVSKPYGESASNQQSEFCDICCRDHHDGGTGESDNSNDPGQYRYNPFRDSGDYHTGGSLSGDHKHYSRDNNGNLTIADSDGDRYVEACRLVRKDGFFRVAQDLRQEGLHAFPASYLDDSADIDEYSGYVTSAVTAYKNAAGDGYETSMSPPFLPSASGMGIVFPASTETEATLMSSSLGLTSQQLRSRGIYIDYMSDDLRGKITCLDEGKTPESCGVPQVSNALEIIPFYEVQLTWLSRWTEYKTNIPIDVTNQAIADDNSHSRGIAELTTGIGPSLITAEVHSGNLGLTGTDPVDLRYDPDLESYVLHAKAVGFGTPPPTNGLSVAGTITSAVNGLKAADVEIEADGAQCDRTSTGFECVVIDGASKPSLKVYNYDKANKYLFACSSDLALTPPRQHVQSNGSGSWTNFSLDVEASITNVTIVIREGGC